MATIRRRPEEESEPKDGDHLGRAWRQRLRLLNVFSTSYFFVVVVACFLITALLTFPHFFPIASLSYWVRLAVLLLLMVETLANYVAVRRTATRNFTSRQAAGLPQSSWPECTSCGLLQPRRAHHCPSCGKCVLRRDHHCFFTNCCIGHFNQRHFFCFLFYVTAGSLFTLVYLTMYMQDALQFPSPLGLGFPHYLLPVALMQWCFGYSSIISFLPVLCFDLILAAGAFASSFTVLQVALIARGQVTHEFFAGITPACPSYLSNFRGVFGERGLLQLLLPLPALRMNRDGVHW